MSTQPGMGWVENWILTSAFRIKRKATAVQLLPCEHCTPQFLVVNPLLSFKTLKRGKPASHAVSCGQERLLKVCFPSITPRFKRNLNSQLDGTSFFIAEIQNLSQACFSRIFLMDITTPCKNQTDSTHPV